MSHCGNTRYAHHLPYSLDQMPWLLFISFNKFVRLQHVLESGEYLRVVVVSLSQPLCLCRKAGLQYDAKVCVVTGSAYKIIWTATQRRNRNISIFAIQIILYALPIAMEQQHKPLRNTINQPKES